MIVSFTIPGDPRGKGRPKFVRATGRTYTDDKTASYENRVMLAAAEAMAGRPPVDDAVHLVMCARVRRPPSAPKKRRLPVTKPDLDNVLKAVLDGCNRIVFTDDARVTGFSVTKVYSDTPGVDVTFEVAA